MQYNTILYLLMLRLGAHGAASECDRPNHILKATSQSVFVNWICSSVSGRPKALKKGFCVLLYSIAVNSYRKFSK